MELLAHICCANCALYPVSAMRGAGREVTGLWHNPNIAPEDEYNRRLGAVRTLSALWSLPVIYREGGSVPPPLEGESRCRACYRARLTETARAASELGFPAFTTTLLVSPYQKHDEIVEAGREAAALYRVEFHYQDFRPGWRQGQGMSRELGFYRQNYCGCLPSKVEADEGRARRRARTVKA